MKYVEILTDILETYAVKQTYVKYLYCWFAIFRKKKTFRKKEI